MKRFSLLMIVLQFFSVTYLCAQTLEEEVQELKEKLAALEARLEVVDQRFVNLEAVDETGEIDPKAKDSDKLDGNNSDDFVKKSGVTENFGIGTTNPSNRLHVKINATSGQRTSAFFENIGNPNSNGIINSIKIGIKDGPALSICQRGNNYTAVSNYRGYGVINTDGIGGLRLHNSNENANIEFCIGTTNNSIPIAYMRLTKTSLNVFGNHIATSSDQRFKTDITPKHDFLSRIMEMQPVSYRWRQKEFPEYGFDQAIHTGFIAQDVESIFPEVISRDDNGYLSIDYTRLVPALIGAVKEQQKIIEELREEIKRIAK